MTTAEVLGQLMQQPRSAANRAGFDWPANEERPRSESNSVGREVA